MTARHGPALIDDHIGVPSATGVLVRSIECAAVDQAIDQPATWQPGLNHRERRTNAGYQLRVLRCYTGAASREAVFPVEVQVEAQITVERVRYDICQLRRTLRRDGDREIRGDAYVKRALDGAFDMREAAAAVCEHPLSRRPPCRRSIGPNRSLSSWRHKRIWFL